VEERLGGKSDNPLFAKKLNDKKAQFTPTLFYTAPAGTRLFLLPAKAEPEYFSCVAFPLRIITLRLALTSPPAFKYQ